MSFHGTDTGRCTGIRKDIRKFVWKQIPVVGFPVQTSSNMLLDLMRLVLNGLDTSEISQHMNIPTFSSKSQIRQVSMQALHIHTNIVVDSAATTAF